ncbi:unnamed protein product [Adineta ricciae]|uniref:Uncharacterized protein n=1 Tax=Adineta ricciae TaxID=249248 RepID=A0A816A5A0_ADIRI|nr:unnamed protein product [Adineta ricciae]
MYFYSKPRHVPSNSVVDISRSVQRSKHVFSKHNNNYNQNRARSSSFVSHHRLCHSHSDDSLEKNFIECTKETVEKLFVRTKFNQMLDQIQDTLQPIAEQLRQRIECKQRLSKQDRLLCMKSCAKFLVEAILNEHWHFDNNFSELYELQHALNHSLPATNIDTIAQTNKQLENDFMQLHIDKTPEKADSSISILPKDSKKSSGGKSFQPTDHLTRQQIRHRSVSSAFHKLNTDLQKLHHETPFKSHLSKYHKHNHE